MRVRRNRGPSPRVQQLADVELNKAALAELRRRSPAAAVAFVDHGALKAEVGVGITPAAVTINGVVAEDFVHLLLEGVRAYGSVVDGAMFYDPVHDEAVVINPVDQNSVVVVKGTLDVEQSLPDTPWGKILAASVRRLSTAYDDGIVHVSRWLLRRASEAALLSRPETAAPQWVARLPRDPNVIWRELGLQWFSQPWGIPKSPVQLGGWV